MGIGFLLFLVPLFIVAAVIMLIARAARRGQPHEDPFQDPHWYWRLFISIPDAVRQLFLVLGTVLASIAALTLFRTFDWPARSDWFVLAGSILALALAYLERAPVALIGGALGGLAWWLAVNQRWELASEGDWGTAVAGLAALGLAYYAAGRAHEIDSRFRRFALFLWMIGTAVLLGLLMWLSSREGLYSVVSVAPTKTVPAAQALALTTLWLIAAGCAVFAMVRRSLLVFEATAVAAAGALVATFALFHPVDTTPYFYETTHVMSAPIAVWAVALNLVLLCALVGLVFLGYERREGWLVTTGAVLLFIFVLMKYFDWLFTFLDRSVGFVLAGVLLLGVGWSMERARRRVITAMEAEHEHD